LRPSWMRVMGGDCVRALIWLWSISVFI